VQRIILHIGLPKTGSTATRSFLDSNIKILEKNNISLVHGVYGGSAWDVPETTSEAELMKRVKSFWEPVEKALKDTQNDVLYSNPSVSIAAGKHPYWLRDLIKIFPENPIVIICYLRRQDRLYESAYMQSLKHFSDPRPFNISPDDSYEMWYRNGFPARLLDYSDWLPKLEECLREQDVLVVRPYDYSQFAGGSIFKDFMQAIEVEWSSDFVEYKKDPNPSIEARFANICARNNAFQHASASRGGYFEESLFFSFMQQVNSIIGSTKNKNLFTYEERLDFLKKYDACNHEVCTKYSPDREQFFSTTDLNPEACALDSFSDGELETAIVVLQHLWVKAVCFEKFSTLNYLRYRQYRELRKTRNDMKTRFRLFLYKTIQSVGKRLFKNWGKLPEMELALKKIPFNTSSAEEVRRQVKFVRK